MQSVISHVFYDIVKCMSEDSASDSWDSQRLSSILNGVSHIEKTESEIVSRSLLPELTVFPLSVKFPTTFPGVALQQKLIVSNGGAEDEDVSITLKGDPEFSVNIETMVVPCGETMSLVVSFVPREVNLYNGSLIIEGRDSVVVALSGHCIPSPLEIPPVESDVWVFANERSEKKFGLRNKSLSVPLKVVLATSSAAFRVVPEEVEIPPASASEITLSYQPKGKLGKANITIQCAQSGDSAMIPLRVGTGKGTILLDFGVTSVGSTVRKTLKLEEKRMAPRVPSPFSVGNEKTPSDSFVISFCPEEAGEFESNVDLGDSYLRLTGTAVKRPYRIAVPFGGAIRPIRISNTSNDSLDLAFSLEPSTFGLSVEEARLDPTETVSIEINVPKTKHRTATEVNFVVTWETSAMDEVRDYYYLIIPGTDRGNHHETELDISSSLESDDEYHDPQPATRMTAKSGFSARRSPKREVLTASKSLIVFPSVSSPSKSATLTISGADSFQLKKPEWLDIPESVSPDVPFDMYVRSIPTSTICANLTARTMDGSLVIPVIAYRGCARIVMDSVIEMNEVSATQYAAKVTVQNTGGRLGFVVFTQPDENEFRVRVSPIAAVIPPNSSVTVKFVVLSPLKDQFSIPVVAYTGDEILRQMDAAVCPSDFFSVAFDDVDVESEISAVAQVLESCKPSDVVSVFKSRLNTTTLTLNSPEQSFEFKQVTVSPSQIEFIGRDPVKLSILNLSPMNLDFVVTPRSSSLAISPLTGLAAPYGETSITVQMLRPDVTAIEIQCGSEHFTVPVSQMIPGKSPEKVIHTEPTKTQHIAAAKPAKQTRKTPDATKCGGFSVDVTSLRFDNCVFGMLATKTIKLSNDEPSPMILQLSSSNSAVFMCQHSVTVPARGELPVEVDFRPDTTGDFQESLTIENDDNQLVLPLIGHACEDTHAPETSVAQSELRFPACQPGAIRRAKIRVANRNSRTAVMRTSITSPFSCPYPEFEVEPFSYVLVPIRFIPKEQGVYEGTATFHSLTGSVTKIHLIGTCFE